METSLHSSIYISHQHFNMYVFMQGGFVEQCIFFLQHNSVSTFDLIEKLKFYTETAASSLGICEGKCFSGGLKKRDQSVYWLNIIRHYKTQLPLEKQAKNVELQ